jgi:hypothetical protein
LAGSCGLDCGGYKQGYLQSGSLAKGTDDKELLTAAGPALFNIGASCKYIRGRKLFRWEPKEMELKDRIGEIVRSEAQHAGFKRMA